MYFSNWSLGKISHINNLVKSINLTLLKMRLYYIGGFSHSQFSETGFAPQRPNPNKNIVYGSLCRS